jgi:hypothetical protein
VTVTKVNAVLTGDWSTVVNCSSTWDGPPGYAVLRALGFIATTTVAGVVPAEGDRTSKFPVGGRVWLNWNFMLALGFPGQAPRSDTPATPQFTLFGLTTLADTVHCSKARPQSYTAQEQDELRCRNSAQPKESESCQIVTATVSSRPRSGNRGRQACFLLPAELATTKRASSFWSKNSKLKARVPRASAALRKNRLL